MRPHVCISEIIHIVTSRILFEGFPLATVIPLGEQVEVRGQPFLIDRQLPQELQKSLLLTKLDINNITRGYSSYLPDSIQRSEDYWGKGFGIEISRTEFVQIRRTNCRFDEIVPLSILAM